MLIRKPFVSAGAVVLVVAVLLCACSPSDPTVRDLGTRAVVIGIDGADWKLIDALAAEGKLPNLTRLREQGTSGPIATLTDIALSPVIWTSVATGKSAIKHGVAWFMVDRPDGTRVPVRSYNRTSKAIWNILADHERRPGVVGWWATYPAEDVGDGIIASDGLGFHGFGSTARDGEDEGKTHPRERFDHLSGFMPTAQQIPAEFVQRFVHLSSDEYDLEKYDPSRNLPRDPTNPIHLFEEYAITAEGYTAITENLLADERFDLFMVYFEQVDSFSHLFMKYAPPRLDWVDAVEFDRYRDVVREWYIYQDELLGRVLTNIDLDTTAVFVLSDHGFKSGERRIRSERTVDIRKAHLDHEPEGIFIAVGPHIRSGVSIDGASVLDITPTVLHYLGFAVGKDMDGRVLEGVFESEFRASNPLRYVETYENEGDAPPATQIAEELSKDEVAQRMAALEALGYVDSAASASAADGGESSPEIHNNLGRIHLGLGELDLAQREFEAALALDPHNADALLNMGSIRRVNGRVAEAEHFVKRALQINPNSIGALAQLAELKRDQNDLDESIRLYREALLIDDSQPFVYLGLGDSLQRAGRYDEAAQAFTSVLELDPDSFEAHYNLGVTRLNQGRLDDAMSRFERALELNPRHPAAAHALNNMGDIQLRRGESEKAIESFQRAVDSSPGHLESRFNLGALHLSENRIDEAIPLLEQAARIEPDHEMVNASLGMAYMRKGRNDDAYRSFLLVRRLYPGNWIAPLGLALLHAGAGQPELAKDFLADALRLGGDTARAEAGNYPVLRDYL